MHQLHQGGIQDFTEGWGTRVQTVMYRGGVLQIFGVRPTVKGQRWEIDPP
jgi:hypothetical protein